MQISEFTKNCPSCGKILNYANKSKLNRSIAKNSTCKPCSKKGEKNPQFNIKENHPFYGKSRLDMVGENNPSKRRDVREKIKNSKMGTSNPMFGKIGTKSPRYGKKHDDVTLKKIKENTKKSLSTIEMREKIRKRTIESQLNISYEEWKQSLSEWEKYNNEVWMITRLQPIQLLENYTKRGRIKDKPDAYHLDHAVSIWYGFKNKIPAEIIGNIKNLRFIKAIENVRKRHNIDKSYLDKIMEGI